MRIEKRELRRENRGERIVMSAEKGKVLKKNLNYILNTIIVLLVAIGTVVMFYSKANATGLMDSGLANFKYYTVLSNEFAGIIAVCQLAAYARGKGYLKALKLTAVTAVSLTFLVVAFFFGPLYGWLSLYQDANLFFHLIVPVVCMVEFLTARDAEHLSIRDSMLASLSTVVYGIVYLVNILINGKGEWPHSNDWYGFLNWGYGMGAVIFAGIILTAFGTACLLRFIKRKTGKR